MKVSDYVMNALVAAGIDHVFTVSGGGIMHLIDSLGSHPALRYTANYHEQACAIAAESYARVRGTPGACLVTTGPGSTNALSGVAGAWVDSIPMIVISGQVRRDLMADYSKVRQLGPQEINIDDMARPITKYFVTVVDPTRIRYEMEKALAIAQSGRPGPVWINLPLDVQGAVIDERAVPAFDETPVKAYVSKEELERAAVEVMTLLRSAKRPVLVPGNGIRLAGSVDGFLELVERLNIPVSTTIGSTDLIAESHPRFIGRFGPLGQRRANFAIQNSDLILAIGASMSLSTIGFNTDSFAPAATKVFVNVDPHEIAKARPQPDHRIVADAAEFVNAMLRLEPLDETRLAPWLDACRAWKAEYPPDANQRISSGRFVDSYLFADELSDALRENDIVLTGNSLDWWSLYQCFKVKQGQRVFTNVNYGSMGWDLPAALGAAIGKQRPVVLVTGDGSIQFNIHELQTVAHYRLPVKIFVLNNGGYAAIRSTQQTHFGGRLVGADDTSGVSNPDFRLLAAAYRLRYEAITTNHDIQSCIRSALSGSDPVLFEVIVDPAQERTPRVMSRRREDGSMESGTLENMFPFLDEEEVARNMRLVRSRLVVEGNNALGSCTRIDEAQAPDSSST